MFLSWLSSYSPPLSWCLSPSNRESHICILSLKLRPSRPGLARPRQRSLLGKKTSPPPYFLFWQMNIFAFAAFFPMILENRQRNIICSWLDSVSPLSGEERRLCLKTTIFTLKCFKKWSDLNASEVKVCFGCISKEKWPQTVKTRWSLHGGDCCDCWTVIVAW